MSTITKGLGAIAVAIGLAAANPALADTAPVPATTTTAALASSSPAPVSAPAPTPKPTPAYNPTGRVTGFTLAYNRLTISGYASDQNSPNSAVRVAIYTAGRTLTFSTGASHRFARRITVPAGRHTVYVTARNVGPGRDTRLFIRTVTVRTLAQQCSARHPFPGWVPLGTRQVISAVGHSSRSTRGTIRELICGRDGVWRTQYGTSGIAHFGADGLGRGSDYTSKTPVGSWALGTVYSHDGLTPIHYSHANYRPGQGCSSSYSWSYNRTEYSTGEMNSGRWATYASQILSNPTNIRGNGSCFIVHYDWWHGTTAGCVGVENLSVLRSLLRDLDSRLNPKIVIAIG